MFETDRYKKAAQDKAWDELSNLSEKVREMVADNVFDTLNTLLYQIRECESPIEQMFCVALIEAIHVHECHIAINMQKELVLEGSKIRVDFLLVPYTEDDCPQIVIECDGHDYHERTKEQAAKDRSRDRLLRRNGYEVMRFTGSEIYQKPYRCASEVITLFRSLTSDT